jgi:hypothetical protein
MNMAPVKREARTFIRKIAGIYGGQVNDRSEHSPSKVHVVARIGICLVRDEADASGSRRLNRPAMKATCHPRQYRAQAVLQRHQSLNQKRGLMSLRDSLSQFTNAMTQPLE